MPIDYRCSLSRPGEGEGVGKRGRKEKKGGCEFLQAFLISSDLPVRREQKGKERERGGERKKERRCLNGPHTF